MSNLKKILDQLEKLDTEKVNSATIGIDRLPAIDIARKINQEDQTVADVVASALEPIAQAAETFAATIKNGHRVFYIGAGTSGRLGVLDAAECPPTFGTDPDQIVGLIAGGRETLVRSREGVEDNRAAAVTDLKEAAFSKDDFLIGLAASRRTPYTLAGLEYAITLQASTAYIVCNRKPDIGLVPQIMIELPVGPEAITGSTRMKSGTAQKMALNMISTTAMVLLGKTYGNLMIDLQARSEKLAARSRKILIDLLDISLADADSLLEQADGSVKLALTMQILGCSAAEATAKLARVDGRLSALLPS